MNALTRIGVMQLTDTLEPGGLERVAVNVANALPADRYRSFLCTTRREGALAEFVSPHVGRLRLKRRHRFDTSALWTLMSFVNENQIGILHAHGSSAFIAAATATWSKKLRVIWHDHFGRYATEQRPAWLYRLAARNFDGVIAVNEPLAQWARSRLGLPSDRVWYVPNFVSAPPVNGHRVELPGPEGFRIVCVANLRPQKDHLNLLQAMQRVVRKIPRAHLILLGQAGNDGHAQRIKAEMQGGGLAGHVTWLGSRSDVAAILRECSVGVLSSSSEGLPLALIEYGVAGLAVVATRVGQCEDVLDHGRAGRLVPPSDPESLARELISLLDEPDQQSCLGRALRARVQDHFGEANCMGKIMQVYDTVLHQGLN